MDYKKLGGRIQTRVINAILGGGEMFISQIHKQNLFFDDGGVAPLGFFLAPAISFFACLSGFILGLLFMQQEVIMSNTNT